MELLWPRPVRGVVGAAVVGRVGVGRHDLWWGRGLRGLGGEMQVHGSGGGGNSLQHHVRVHLVFGAVQPRDGRLQQTLLAPVPGGRKQGLTHKYLDACLFMQYINLEV